jgi:hypothetical protein
MKDEKFNDLIVMIWRFVSTGLILVFLTCLFSSVSGCQSGKNKSNKNNILSLPSYSKSAKTKSQKSKKAKDAPKSLDEILALPRS